MKTEEALFEDLAEIYDHWVSVAIESTANSEASLKWTDDPEAFKRLGEVLQDTNTMPQFEQAISELLRGVMHSFLVTLDGGTKLAEKTNLSIADDMGYTLPKNLHEGFVDFLFETRRLK